MLYKITIGQNTQKGKFQNLKDIFVQSENIINDVQEAYSQKYNDFNVKYENTFTI